ncbi:MAG: MogA/MoaB family molybdenum cofactor biosynthesis protein, partial [Elusimicrobiota bacterium]|nr:MogA/MoaB family molybdenum cofactor biosynthesis protein [Elusimicrobiota bacterium]
TTKYEVVKYEVLPDEKVLIAKKLIDWSDNDKLDLIFTTGGTGIAPRDKTPEATKEIVFFEVPGIAEIIRYEGYKKTPFAVLSRGICGVRRKTLIINLPGSEQAVKECLEIIAPIIPHAIELLHFSNAHRT